MLNSMTKTTDFLDTEPAHHQVCLSVTESISKYVNIQEPFIKRVLKDKKVSKTPWEASWNQWWRELLTIDSKADDVVVFDVVASLSVHLSETKLCHQHLCTYGATSYSYLRVAEWYNASKQLRRRLLENHNPATIEIVVELNNVLDNISATIVV